MVAGQARAGGGRPLLLCWQGEDWHHLLPHLWRQRHRRHRAGAGAGAARPRGPLHHQRQPHPAGPGGAAHPLPRGRGLHLPAVPVPALLPGAGLAHGGGGLLLQARPAARPLRHPALHLRPAGAADAGPAAATALRHHPARHRHHPGGRRPLLFPHHPVLHRAVRRRHRHQPLPAPAHRRGLRHPQAGAGDPQLRQLRGLPPGARSAGGGSPRCCTSPTSAR